MPRIPDHLNSEGISDLKLADRLQPSDYYAVTIIFTAALALRLVRLFDLT